MSHTLGSHPIQPGDRVHLHGSQYATELQAWFEEHAIVDAWEVMSFDCSTGAAHVYTIGEQMKRLEVVIHVSDLMMLNEVPDGD